MREKVKKIIDLLKENNALERFNMKTKKWELVPINKDDPDVIRLLEYMKAEIEIMIRKEEIELNFFSKKKEDLD